MAAFSLRAMAEITDNSNGGETASTYSLAHDPRLPLFGVTPENLSMLLLPMLINQCVLIVLGLYSNKVGKVINNRLRLEII